VRYLSVCSGIEAATVAWHPLGWEPVAFSEIEPFPSAVLKHHYPSVPNLGDMTKHESWPLDVGSVDLLVGGTPCQSFSVAGLRKGLSDPRGGLMLTYLEIARRLRPRWVVWENVPGVLSSGRGRDFGSFLGALGELGYGWAYRVLDAQWVRTQRHPRAVPQRRRRVFVVGCLGDATAARAVLFERESVCRDHAPRGKAREEASSDAQESVSGCIGAGLARSRTELDRHGAYIVEDEIAIQGNLVGRNAGGPAGVGVSTEGASYTLTKADVHAVAFRKSKRAQSVTDDESWVEAEQANTVNAFDTGERDTHAIVHSLPDAPKPPADQVCIECGNDLAVAENWHCLECLSDDPKLPKMATAVPVSDSLVRGNNQYSGFPTEVVSTSAMTVRRLTPRECERLQAFPDDYTMIPWRGKSAADCPDGPRYKALGNSMAVNCMEWIGERIAAYEDKHR
jgi:DNA (cytosine-5)-methyltransferase 1